LHRDGGYLEFNFDETVAPLEYEISTIWALNDFTQEIGVRHLTAQTFHTHARAHAHNTLKCLAAGICDTAVDRCLKRPSVRCCWSRRREWSLAVIDGRRTAALWMKKALLRSCLRALL
jgi:hypothetical protein